MTATDQVLTPEQDRTGVNWKAPLVALFGVAVVAMGAIWWSFLSPSQMQKVEVLSRSGDVRMSRAADNAKAGTNTAEGTIVETGSDGLATVRLEDGSVINVMPDSKLTIEQARADRSGQRFTTDLRLDLGEVTSRIKRGDNRTREVTLRSKSVAIGVRGTVFSVKADPGVSRVVVTRGKVQVDGTAGDGVSLSANYGTVVETGKAPESPTKLPAAPAPVSPEVGARVGGESELAFVWQAEDGIAATELQIANDEDFNDLVLRTTAGVDGAKLGNALPRDGRYFWRIAAVDGRGLRGQWSTPQVMLYKYYYEQGQASLDSLNAQELLANFRRGERGLADEAAFLSDRGQAHLAERELGKARIAFEALETLAPNSVNALLGLAHVDLREGKFEAAGDRIAPLLGKRPKDVAVLVTAATADVGLGQKQRARSLVERALVLEPGNANAKILKQSLERGAPVVGVPGQERKLK